MTPLPEILSTCPDCAQPGFTASGLKSHQGNPRCQAAALKTLAPYAEETDLVSSLAVIALTEDIQLGSQLAAQWDLAIGGTKAQIVFGAMMMQLRSRVDSACGINSATRGPTAKGKGLKAWLKEFAPTVSTTTAYRFMEIAEGLQSEFKLGKSVDLAELLECSVDELAEELRKKRVMIEDCITGKSQRQLLLQFGGGPSKMRGGHHPSQQAPKTAEERQTAWEAAAREDFLAVANGMKEIGIRWQAGSITDAEREIYLDASEDLIRTIRTWLATPKNKRVKPDLESFFTVKN